MKNQICLATTREDRLCGKQFILLMLIIFSLSVAGKAEAPFFAESQVWGYYEDGLYPYHIQSITVTNSGTLLAFAEGRIEPDDDGAHHVVLKRSTNGGVSWGANQYVVLSANGESFGNPTLVVDKNTGKIFMFYARNYTQQYTRVYYKTSVDDGVTWSNSTEVTSLFNNDPFQRPFHLPGPGHGIQLANGRLMIQVWHRTAINPDNICCDPPAPERKYGVSVIYSDNGGANWQSGGYTPIAGFFANESRIVELNNGSLVINARDAVFGLDRIRFTSTNQGANWSNGQYDSSLSPYSAVDSGMERLTLSGSNNFNRVLFSRPIDPDSRTNLMVSLSYSETASWSFSRTVYGGHATYSDLAVSNDKSRIFVLYGRDGTNFAFPDKTFLARFNLEWLTGGRDSLARTGSTTFVPTYQAEDLHITDSSADTTGTFADAAASGGRVLKYLSDEPGDYITLNVHVPTAKTYNVRVRSRTANNRALVQLDINGTNRGQPINPYSSTVGYREDNIGSVPLNAGINTFKFTAVGLPAGSTGYTMFPDSIVLTPQ